MTTPIIPPLHVADLSPLQSAALAALEACQCRTLVDPDGYVTDDALAVELRFLALAATL